MSNKSAKLNYGMLTILLFMAAIFLRVLLFWAVPPQTYYDNHYEPIFKIMSTGKIPAKDACPQCYQPPVFYWISAMAGKVAVKAGLRPSGLVKFLQFIPCLCGILTLMVVYFILKRLPLSDFSRFFSFGLVCFLPRHIYMSAIHSNDSMSCLFVALTIYVLFVALDRRLPVWSLIALSITASIAIFTKYNDFVVLPAIAAVFVSIFYRRLIGSRKRIAISFILAVFLPLLLLGVYMTDNYKQYGSLLPWNVSQFDPTLFHAHDNVRLDLISFKPWEVIQTPIIVPGEMHSFWTLVYGGMWFDNTTKLIFSLNLNNSNLKWWLQYFHWRNGRASFPGYDLPLSALTRFIGTGLLSLGLVPLYLMISGLFFYLARRWEKFASATDLGRAKMAAFPMILFFNAAGIVALAIRLPDYSTMNATYFLVSMPAFAALAGLGIMQLEKNKKLKWAIASVCGVIFTLASVHILQIAYSLICAEGH